jgi:transcription initiation factor IIE alpha subunit
MKCNCGGKFFYDCDYESEWYMCAGCNKKIYVADVMKIAEKAESELYAIKERLAELVKLSYDASMLNACDVAKELNKLLK